jgi:hypothetical protein
MVSFGAIFRRPIVAIGKFWCDFSTSNRGENTVTKKRTVFLRGRKNRQMTCPTKSSIIIRNPSTILTPQNPGKKEKKKKKKGLYIVALPFPLVKKYLQAKEELRKLKYFQPCKNIIFKKLIL